MVDQKDVYCSDGKTVSPAKSLKSGAKYVAGSHVETPEEGLVVRVSNDKKLHLTTLQDGYQKTAETPRDR